MPITMVEGEAVKLDTFAAVLPTMTVMATDDNAVLNVVDVVYNADLMKRIAKIEAAIAAQA